MYYLTINGESFCDWTGCMAHQSDARKALVTECEYVSADFAIAAARRIKALRPQSLVCVAMGDCPARQAVEDGEEPHFMLVGETVQEVAGYGMIDPQLAFADAIHAGRLSASPSAANYAGHYMYMGTHLGEHAFKHRDTRQYLA